ncbi:MAG TPA: RyR domain-containing protein [Chthoniobacterales bacterium]
MSQIKSSGQNLFFLVAGDSIAAALTALELARQGIPAKLVAAPGSPAAGIAISFGITLDPGSFSLFLGRVGLADITHLILFPTDLCELALWLAAAEDAVETKGRRTPLSVFAAAPNAESLAAVRRGVVVIEPQPSFFVQFFSTDEDVARDFVFQFFGNKARGSDGADGFLIVGSNPLAEAIALKIAKLGGLLDGSKTKLDWIVTRETAQRIDLRYPALKEICILNFHSPELEPLTMIESFAEPTRALILAEGSRGLEECSTIGQRGVLKHFAGTFVPHSRADRLNRVFRKHFAWGANAGYVRFFGDYSVIASLARFTETGRFRLPRSIHERYCEARMGEGELPVDNTSLKPWHAIDEDLRQSNRERADHVIYVLGRLGYLVEEGRNDIPSSVSFSKEVLEQLARLEHMRWAAERRLAWWSFGAIRDNTLRRHPLLVPYEALEEGEKEKDRQTMRDIPEVLRRAGLVARSGDQTGMPPPLPN